MHACKRGLKKGGLVLAASVLAAAALLVLLLTMGAAEAAPSQAAAPAFKEWVLVAYRDGGMGVIDPATDALYGPFLLDELGTEGGGRFDVAVTPDGKTALISNFGDSAVFFVDMTNPIAPSLITSVTMPMFAEDIAISPDGQTALVTDGGFSPYVMVIDLPSRTLAYTVTLPSTYASAVDMAPNGTVIVADYFQGTLATLYPDASGQLTVTGVYSYLMNTDGTIADIAGPGGGGGSRASDLAGLDARHATGNQGMAGLDRPGVRLTEIHMPRAVNVSIAPDGQTVLAGDVSAYNEPDDPMIEAPLYDVAVYRITAPGVISFTGVITGMSRATQSIAFSPDGRQAYLSGNGGIVQGNEINHMSVLDIVSPGVVRLNQDNAVELSRFTSSQLFGVDSVTVANEKVYFGHPTLSDAEHAVRIVRLSDMSVRRLDTPDIPVGVTAITFKKVYLPAIVKSVP
ncbi:MAG: hypothetical protein JXA89_26145 [Anaerolineae bacterium]|nr:hypothetical protein [Anaerolineae bacterium]